MLQQLDRDLWTAARPFSLMGLRLGNRTTVVRLRSGGLLVHAPVAPTPELRAALDALGPVEFVVAPNAMHHLFLAPFLAAYPNARGFAAAGAMAKHPELKLAAIPGSADAPWADDLDHRELLGAPQLGEVAFFHRASRTLILTDWLFYFEKSPSFLTGLYLRLAGALGRPVQTAVMRKLIRDRAAARQDVAALLAWDFERIVVSHHDILATGGKQALRDATAWLDK